MNIDEQGYSLDTLQTILDAVELQLQGKYGSDFVIKPEGVIDNIFTSVGFIELSLQEKIAFLIKQLDPETAEGIYQDFIYERQGVYRLSAQKTIIEKTVNGPADSTIASGEILIRNNRTKDEFINKSEITTDANGNVVADFECVLYGKNEVLPVDEFVIVSAPNEIIEVVSLENGKVIIGRDAETDEEYRVRFRSSKAINSKASHNANISNLSKYVSHSSYLRILDKKSDKSMEAGTIKIIANHNTTDNIFAMAILDTIAGGIVSLGDTMVLLQDNANEWQEIRFQNAKKVHINIQADIKIRYGKYSNTVIAATKKSIINYAQERIFGLESIVYATEFIIPALQTDGVEAFTNIKVKKSTDAEYSDSVSLAIDEVAEFSIDGIILNEVE